MKVKVEYTVDVWPEHFEGLTLHYDLEKATRQDMKQWLQDI